MKVCDICGEPSSYNTYVYKSSSNGESADLCYRCYHLLSKKENKYKHLAYEETVQEVEGEPQEKIDDIKNKVQNPNWFQKLMWKWCFGIKVEDYNEE